eukprot:CAMPEP_0176126642 /NCGR_PEP_ID=MMETSP0120_2-20121206/63924_1 /TAXON_ID=160619 /ORGANISM="Kryptoperidinium foliaceum, Strain CCMP 1326" /LENGTH=189 /DNA_ID=CAMNT_0017461581 /DNA_START=54 /DNA_END=619 /DNA_ORIENTATION=+
MAPASKAARGKKAVKKTSGVKVKRQAKTNVVKAAPVKPLPKDWPVASRPPTLTSENSALRPGSLLQDVCSGQDIHINKQALQAPNVEKGKGRYMLIFPGEFSFRNFKNGDSKEPSNKSSEEDISEKNSQDDNEDDEEDEDDNDVVVGDGGKTAAKPVAPQMGKVEGLTTDHPKFRISFPGSDKSLVFPG